MKKRPKAKSKGTPAGREIIAALTDLVETLKAGTPLESKYTVRHVSTPDPGEYDAKAIRATRELLGISQRVFAKLIGVSTVLVQSWEQRKRFPDATARRLLDEINRDPAHWRSLILPVEHPSIKPRHRTYRKAG